MENIKTLLSHLGLPSSFHVTYIVEILILAVLIYELLVWVKDTRAWTLLKGIIIVLIFVAFCYLFNLTTLTWLISKTAGVIVIMLVILFQPELRHALEQLGRSNFLKRLLKSPVSAEEAAMDPVKINSEIVRACFEMAKTRTGALIVMTDIPLEDIERTGIPVDALVSSQLIINIFVKNTPLHDGAIIIRDGRVVSATCYLPTLIDAQRLGKEFGTRHRAALAMSDEPVNTLTIVVSEETGDVSVARKGTLTSGMTREGLKELLMQYNVPEEGGRNGAFEKLKGMLKHDRKDSDS